MRSRYRTFRLRAVLRSQGRFSGSLTLIVAPINRSHSSQSIWSNTRRYSALGMLICSALGLLLVLLLPWDRYLAGFALYQSYSPFLLVRYAPQIFFLILVAALLGIPLSFFLPRRQRKA